MPADPREERLDPDIHDRYTVRSPAQRDRDRILYSSALRRLAGVTQVVDPAEGHVFHNRLTHSLEVAMIARRLAEKLNKEQPEVAKTLGTIDPNVVEAAALAHDLGHPPFGHIAETALDKCVRDEGLLDGYEGNAQAFRILTKLERRDDEHPGLNLTLATLNAVLKYPLPQDERGSLSKYGVYRTELREFNRVRTLYGYGDNKRRTLEAELMDWADDVAYAVHDFDDFFRAGLIPHDCLAGRKTRNDLVEAVLVKWRKEIHEPDRATIPSKTTLHAILRRFSLLLPLPRPFHHSLDDHGFLVMVNSALINRFINVISLNNQATLDSPHRKVVIPIKHRAEIRLLKELTWHHVINKPPLATQQFAKKHIIEQLFATFLRAFDTEDDVYILPTDCKERMDAIKDTLPDSEIQEKQVRARLIADIISGMTDAEAFALYQRLYGINRGSIHDRMPH
jgi:dGTPase